MEKRTQTLDRGTLPRRPNVFTCAIDTVCICISFESWLSSTSAAVLWWWCSCSRECTAMFSGVEVVLMTMYWPCVLALFVPSPAQPILYWCSRNMSFWSSISFNLAVLMNLLVAFFYPLEGLREGQSHVSNRQAFTFNPSQSLDPSQNLDPLIVKPQSKLTLDIRVFHWLSKLERGFKL